MPPSATTARLDVSGRPPSRLLFPSAIRVRFGKCAIVRFRRAALAAFLTFRRAASRCFDDVMLPLCFLRGAFRTVMSLRHASFRNGMSQAMSSCGHSSIRK
jgi:hypothetical protein